MDSFRLQVCVFFPYDLAIYPWYTTVINLSIESNYMLSPISSSSESLNVRVVLGIPHKLM